MRTIEADLNMRNRTTDWKIPLGSINAARVQRGQVVRLEGEFMEVEATVEVRGALVVAVPRWDTLAYIH